MSRTDSLRFRQSGATLVAALIAFVSAVPLAGARWALAPILLVPLAAGIWAWRAGTDVDAVELRVRALLGTTHIAWDRVAGLAADPRGRAMALLTDGRTMKLTGVRAADLPAVVAAAGGKLDRPAGSAPTDPGPTDSGPTDSGPTDSGPTDPGPTDSGPTDPGPTNSDPAGSVPVDDPVDQRLPRDEPA